MTAAGAEQRAVIALIEPLVVQCRASWRRSLGGMAREVGVPEAALLFLFSTANVIDGGAVTVAVQREKAPYSTKEPWRARWAELVAGGLAEPLADGWRITSSGQAALERLMRSSWRHFASLALPAEELARTRRDLEEVISRIGPDTPRMRWTRRLAARGEAANADGVRLEHAILLLLMHRIDAHVSAWRAAGYAGPELDVLTQAWSGLRTIEEIERALATKQDPEDVRQHLARLAERGDLTLDGPAVGITAGGKERRDAIEAETDRVGLAPWPEGEPLRRLGRDLEVLTRSVPAGAPQAA